MVTSKHHRSVTARNTSNTQNQYIHEISKSMSCFYFVLLTDVLVQPHLRVSWRIKLLFEHSESLAVGLAHYRLVISDETESGGWGFARGSIERNPGWFEFVR
jgi:hypothetical protein